jgi:hypothetical protein
VDGFNGASGTVVPGGVQCGGNDSFTSSQVITGTVGSVNGNNSTATGEPVNRIMPKTRWKVLWYSWTGADQWSRCGGHGKQQLRQHTAVYTAPASERFHLSRAMMTSSAESPPKARLTFRWWPGPSHRIAVDGFNGTSGNVVLNWFEHHLHP